MKRIVILGGGFGGIRCALDCARKFGDSTSITLIDRNGYHSFTPALYEIASAYQTSDDPYALHLRRAVSIPYADIFEGKKVNVIQAEIASVDLNSHHVILDSGSQLDFDYLVFGLGAQTADFGIPGVYEYAYQFKTTDDAVALNNKLVASFKEVINDATKLPMKFMVIGGGFTGIELAAELMTCGQKLCRNYNLNRRAFSVMLFEAAPTILPMIKDSERKKIMSRLTELGVVIMANSSIENVSSTSIKLNSGQTIIGTAVVWTAGVQPSKLASTIHNFPVTERGKVIVDSNLRVQNFEHIFALGDSIEFIDPNSQKSVPGLAYVAQAQGRVVANNIFRTINGKKLDEYSPEYNSWIAPVGGKFAIAHIKNLGTYGGLLGWFMKVIIDLRYFISILTFSRAVKLFRRETMLFSKND